VIEQRHVVTCGAAATVAKITRIAGGMSRSPVSWTVTRPGVPERSSSLGTPVALSGRKVEHTDLVERQPVRLRKV
jgi:hypothetical protein